MKINDYCLKDEDIKHKSMLFSVRDFQYIDTIELHRHLISGTSIDFESIFQPSKNILAEALL